LVFLKKRTAGLLESEGADYLQRSLVCQTRSLLAIAATDSHDAASSMEAIIDLLEKNALMPRDEMAKLLGMSRADLDAKIAKLEADGVILGYQAVVNREKWDTENVSAVIEVKITPERDGGFDRIASRIARFDEVQSCYLVSGGYDLLIIVEARNLRAAAAFVAEKLSTIDAVQSTATHFRLKTYKENGTFHLFEPTSERLSVSP
jgi:DNA-binding Lrp family transcriptional regulator